MHDETAARSERTIHVLLVAAMALLAVLASVPVLH